MIDSLLHAFRDNPEIAIFLSIALGTWIGKIKFGKFHLGTVAGSLLMGLIIGQIDIEIPSMLKAVFFALFIYAVGFKSGPGFFGSLNRETIKLVLLSVILCVTGLLTILAMNAYFGFDAGFAAGLGAGALTDTAMMGTASSAMHELDISAAELERLNSHMAIAYAITYIFGTVGLIIFVSSVAPLLLKINLRQAAIELEAELAGKGKAEGKSNGEIHPYSSVVARAHVIEEDKPANGQMICEVEAHFPRMSIERVIRDGQVLDRDVDLRLKAGDIVAVLSRRELVTDMDKLFGPEVDNQQALSFPRKTVHVVLDKREYVGKKIGDLRQEIGPLSRHGIFVNKIIHAGYGIVPTDNTIYRFGDVAEIAGRPESVNELAGRFGRVKAEAHKSDIAIHTLAIVLGTLIGLITAHIGVVPIELGVGGGILVVALIVGWAHSRYQGVGDLPPAAQWAFSELGLTAFAAVVGLMAGPRAIEAMHEHGMALLIAGVIVTLVPPIVAFYAGRYLLKIHPLILLGGIAGAQTEAASMNTIIEESGSQTPVIGFTVCYAISNVLFAVWGPIIVALT
ncbi:MAG: aspartate-alanine antiporter [Burkholderiaceae bacterium]|nr:aspartate-alanine antiporter [Burkholderiaceae bacterium]MCD8517031.1 aspartate-alanine antiporter [Burkholderiaceae bacterium]MCD8536923.1 aspartate-alanine antiporter [Burkholderiaceae bacterium]MCD8566051.1 aspartate-alanine antiporter [Burkholderiaceae bacterium]